MINDILSELTSHLTALTEWIEENYPTGVAAVEHGNPAIPAVSKSDILLQIEEIVNFITNHEFYSDEYSVRTIEGCSAKINYLLANNAPNMWGNPTGYIPAFLLTLSAVSTSLRQTAKETDLQAISSAATRQKNTIRSLDARIAEITAKSTSLEAMVKGIEDAHEVAERLPADLKDLIDSHAKVTKIKDNSQQIFTDINNFKANSSRLLENLQEMEAQAQNIMEQCEKTYTAATSQGLASAFSERSKSLNNSTYLWMVALAIALGAGGTIGFMRIGDFNELILSDKASGAAIFANFLLSFLSLAAPVWLAWLATRQIGQRFRLAEDYAFKASISRAYEGFRREAAKVDSNMEAQLLASALTRLDEQPLRLVESASHATPLQDLMSSETGQKIASMFPAFSQKFNEIIAGNQNKLTSNRYKTRQRDTDLPDQDFSDTLQAVDDD